MHLLHGSLQFCVWYMDGLCVNFLNLHQIQNSHYSFVCWYRGRGMPRGSNWTALQTKIDRKCIFDIFRVSMPWGDTEENEIVFLNIYFTKSNAYFLEIETQIWAQIKNTWESNKLIFNGRRIRACDIYGINGNIGSVSMHFMYLKWNGNIVPKLRDASDSQIGRK